MMILAPEPLIHLVGGSFDGVGLRQSVLFFDVEVYLSFIKIVARIMSIVVQAGLLISFFAGDVPWGVRSTTYLCFLLLKLDSSWVLQMSEALYELLSEVNCFEKRGRLAFCKFQLEFA